MTSMTASAKLHPAPQAQAEFRDAVAFVARMLIRARDVSEPGFLSKKEYQDWRLNSMPKERVTPRRLLDAAYRKLQDIDVKLLFLCPSGGVSCPEEPADQDAFGQAIHLLEQLVAPFYSFFELIADDEARGRVDWTNVADWSALSPLRKVLDQLPDSQSSRTNPVHPDGPDENHYSWWNQGT